MCFIPCILINAYKCWQLVDWSTLLSYVSHIMLHMQGAMPIDSTASCSWAARQKACRSYVQLQG